MMWLQGTECGINISEYECEEFRRCNFFDACPQCVQRTRERLVGARSLARRSRRRHHNRAPPAERRGGQFVEDIGMQSFLSAASERADDLLPTECPICLSAPPDKPCKTKCGHVFCTDCLSRTFFATASTGACPLCRTQVSLYSTTALDSGRTLLTPAVTSIAGCVYLQQGSLGEASYHFDTIEASYISYASAPATWTLDDGSRPPQRKTFLSPAYDEATRTFTGVIDWAPTSFGGDERWEYRMVFSDTFNTICDGELRAFAPDGSEKLPLTRFPATLMYWRQLPNVTTIIGSSYVQGETLGMASYHFEPPDVEVATVGEGGAEQQLGECYISYACAPEPWTLDDGTRPPARKPFMQPVYDSSTRTFTGAIDWGESGFGGDARWEYTMIFAPNFSFIAAGTVQAYRADGQQSRTHHFGTHLNYTRHAAERAEMLELVRRTLPPAPPSAQRSSWLSGRR